MTCHTELPYYNHLINIVDGNNLGSVRRFKLQTNQEIEAECRQIVDEGVEFARSSPELEVHEMFNTIYTDMDGVRIRGADSLTYGIHSP